MIGKKKIRRNPNKPRNMYFGDEAQSSIEKYHGCPVREDKHRIYENEIYPVFEQLVDNLIKVYDFKSCISTQVELKTDCLAFLFESINKWDPSRGTKAFSYFNVVAKNWLIISARKQTKRAYANVSIDDINSLTTSQRTQIEEYDVIPSPDDVMIQSEVKHEIIKMLGDMKLRMSSDNELKCLHAIETLFNSIDELELLNKRAIYVYIREISGLDRKTLSKVMANIKKHYLVMSRNNSKYSIF
jgi:hypothetical protein